MTVTADAVVVNAVATAARQVVWAGKGPQLLENRDLLTTVYLGSDEGTDPGGNDTVPLDPLGNKAFDGSSDWWARTISGGAVVVSIPGGTGSQVSPVLIAEQLAAAGLATAANQVTGTAAVNSLPGTISTTGAPNLAFHRQIVTATNQTITAATEFLTSASNLTGPSYDLFVELHAAASAFARITLYWYDSASGLLIDQHRYWVIPGNGVLPHQIVFHGPTVANQLIVGVEANTATVNLDNLYAFQNSRSYERHTAYSYVWGQTNNVGNVALDDPTNLVIGEGSHGLTTGTSTTYYLPLYAGKVRLSGATSSNTTDANLEVFTIADQNLGSAQIAKLTSDSGGNWNAELSLPRTQCQVTLVNHNAGTQTLTFAMIGEDY